MTKQFLIPFGCCIFTSGYCQSVIIDTQRYTIEVVPNEIFHIINDSKTYTIMDLKKKCGLDTNLFEEYIHHLVKNEYCFIGSYSERSQFHHVNNKWEHELCVTNSILDFDTNSQYDLLLSIHQLSILGCGYIQFRFFGDVNKQLIYDCLANAQMSTIRGIEIIFEYLSFNNTGEIYALSENFPKISHVAAYGSPFEKISNAHNASFHIIFSKHTIDNHAACGLVGGNTFSLNLQHITESFNYNTCLNRKICIDVKGEIKNCPSMSESFGNIKNTTLKEALNNKDFKKLWNITKDNIDVCKDCEFRYVCTDCRAYRAEPDNMLSQPAKCTYNPYIALWQGQEGYCTVSEWRNANNKPC